MGASAPRQRTAAARYSQLEKNREPFLREARECSKYTLPALLPPEGQQGQELYKPYQSVGADCVNNLAAKVLLALFPPGTSPMRLKMPGYLIERLKQNADGDDAVAAFEAALGKMEREVMDHMESSGSRTTNFEGIKHKIVAGNVLIHIDKDSKERLFPLDRYVVKRDASGNVLEVVVKETFARSTLSEEARSVLESVTPEDKPGDDSAASEDKSVDVYTWVRRTSKRFEVHQEVSGKIIPGTQGFYPEDKAAWLPLRWTKVAGEDYGRGRVSEYLGDFRSLEAHEKALANFSAAASKIIMMVKDGSLVDKNALAEAESGDVLDGDVEEVGVLRIDKMNDFNVVYQKSKDLEQRLNAAFLKASAIQRQAERVTAEEIRAMIGELEQGLGGVYSIQAEEFQRPLFVRVIHQMQVAGKLPKLPKNSVRPQIVTGLEALGRASDLQKLDLLIAGIAQNFGPEAVAQTVNPRAYFKRRAAALGIDTEGLAITDEQAAQSQKQAQAQALVEKHGGTAMKLMSEQVQAPAQQPAA